MIIELAEKYKGHTVKVTAGGKTLYLDRDLAAEAGIKPGRETNGKELEDLLRESDYRRAKSRALWFLDRADHSEKSLCEKITRAGISTEAALRAIERLKELGLVDDRRYAENLYARFAAANVSKRAAYAKMYEKGVPAGIIKEVLSQSEVNEQEQLEALIERRYRAKLSAPDGPGKVAAALIRKGFSFDVVRAAVKKYTSEDLQEEA